jgi:hypothetical protein
MQTFLKPFKKLAGRVLLGLKPVFHLRIFSREANFSFVFVSQLEPSGTNWIKTKENFASREKFASGKPALNLIKHSCSFFK